MKYLSQTIPPSLRTWVKRISYFIVGTVLTVFYADLVHAQGSNHRTITQTPYTWQTILTAIIATVITIFYFRGMYLILTYAAETYNFEDEDDLHRPDTSEENNGLLYGTFGWILGSAIVITSYGWGWRFLYIGPIVCLLGPLVPIIAMQFDIQKYKQILSFRQPSRR